MTNWTVFTATGQGGSKYRPYRDRPCIIVNKRGEILFSTAAFKMMGNPRYVQCLNDVNGRLGFKGCDRALPGAYKAQDRNYTNTRRISGKSFTKAFNLIEGKARVYQVFKEGDILVFNPTQRAEYP